MQISWQEGLLYAIVGLGVVYFALASNFIIIKLVTFFERLAVRRSETKTETHAESVLHETDEKKEAVEEKEVVEETTDTRQPVASPSTAQTTEGPAESEPIFAAILAAIEAYEKEEGIQPR